MIKINGVAINTENYPDGTQRIKFKEDIYEQDKVDIAWFYEGDAEFMTLFYITNHLRDLNSKVDISLYMYYIPNARTDKVNHKIEEVFTLRYFCEAINGLNFDKVYVLDPYSNVSVGMLERCFTLDPTFYINKVLQEIGASKEDMVLYFSNIEVYKKYKDMFRDYKCCYGEEELSLLTNKIIDVQVKFEKDSDNPKRKIVLMISDIITYGRTITFGANALYKLGAKIIYCYATHTEPNIFDEEKGTLLRALECGMVERLFTTDSIFRHSSTEHIKVFRLSNSWLSVRY